MSRAPVVRRVNVALGVVVVGLGLTSPIAHASFPGANGRIAFGITTSCGLQDIATMRTDGSDLRVLTPGACRRWNKDFEEPLRLAPDWSPDGDHLLFLRDDDWSFAGP